VDVKHINGVALITLARTDVGEEAVQAFGSQMSYLVDRCDCRKCVVNLGGAQCLSSTALGKLIASHKRLKQVGGELTLCGLTPELGARLKDMRLDKLFHICASEEEALGATPAGAG
jgi:anti-anti-sigma factor